MGCKHLNTTVNKDGHRLLTTLHSAARVSVLTLASETAVCVGADTIFVAVVFFWGATFVHI